MEQQVKLKQAEGAAIPNNLTREINTLKKESKRLRRHDAHRFRMVTRRLQKEGRVPRKQRGESNKKAAPTGERVKVGESIASVADLGVSGCSINYSAG